MNTLVTHVTYLGNDAEDIRDFDVKPIEQYRVERLFAVGRVVRLRHRFIGGREAIIFDYALGDALIAYFHPVNTEV